MKVFVLIAVVVGLVSAGGFYYYKSYYKSVIPALAEGGFTKATNLPSTDGPSMHAQPFAKMEEGDLILRRGTLLSESMISVTKERLKAAVSDLGLGRVKKASPHVLTEPAYGVWRERWDVVDEQGRSAQFYILIEGNQVTIERSLVL